MTLKYLCAAVALAGVLLSGSDAALAARGMGGGLSASSPTSGAIPPSGTSAAIRPSPSLPIVGQRLPSFGASTLLVAPQLQPPVPTSRPPMGAPYQPPCGTYPLPQC